MRLLFLKTVVVGLIVLAAATPPEIAHAQNKAFVMKISPPMINDPSYQFAENFAASLERDSSGRIKPQVFPQANSARSLGRSREPSSAPSNAQDSYAKFQTEPINRLGATSVVMTLGDVLPALRQGTIDGIRRWSRKNSLLHCTET